MRKRLFSILTALALCLTLLPATALAENDGIDYLDVDGETRTCVSAAAINGDSSWDDGCWYVADGSNPTLDGDVTVGGDVYLILADGCTLTIGGRSGALET